MEKDGLVTTCSTTTTTNKKAKKAKLQKPRYFKPILDEVAIFVNDKEAFSFQNIIITPFDHNILYDDVMTKLKGLDMGGEDRFVIVKNLTVHMLRENCDSN